MTKMEVSVYGVKEMRDGGLIGLGEDRFHTHYQFTAPYADLVAMKAALNGQPGPEVDFPNYLIDLDGQVLDSSDERYSEIPSTREPRDLTADAVKGVEIAA